MSFLEELADFTGEDLVDFLLRDDIPCPEIPVDENSLMEDWSLIESELPDEEMYDIINSVMSPLGSEPDILQGSSHAGNDSGISEGQHLSHSPGSDFASSSQSSDVVQVDHNYSLHLHHPALESLLCNMAEGGFSAELGPYLGLEGTSTALEQNASFPFAVAVDAGPQLVPGAIVQSNLPDLVLVEGESQLLENEGPVLPVPNAEEQLLNEVYGEICNKQSAQENCHEMNCMDDLEDRVAACTAQNHELKKVQLLQKLNICSLLGQLQDLEASVTQPATKTAAAKTCTMVMVLSFSVLLSSGLCSFLSEEVQPELRELSQQTCDFPNQTASDVQENPALEGFSPEPEEPSLLGSESQSQEEMQSSPNPYPRSSFNSISSSEPSAAAGAELGLPQLQ
ncbi:PREDICTED: cyclic AMP-responsive element-binding protein 3-like protein 3-B, partial [Buceros rhinoceros silvestris]|uniref:cyclic AMP-responsive element-binding protein 3-like protein 3-B n=1 Tax=Buceros rhinoceros silvestris TaxID=175836 RepID=UPI0005284346